MAPLRNAFIIENIVELSSIMSPNFDSTNTCVWTPTKCSVDALHFGQYTSSHTSIVNKQWPVTECSFMADQNDQSNWKGLLELALTSVTLFTMKLIGNHTGTIHVELDFQKKHLRQNNFTEV